MLFGRVNRGCYVFLGEMSEMPRNEGWRARDCPPASRVSSEAVLVLGYVPERLYRSRKSVEKQDDRHVSPGKEKASDYESIPVHELSTRRAKPRLSRDQWFGLLYARRFCEDLCPTIKLLFVPNSTYRVSSVFLACGLSRLTAPFFIAHPSSHQRYTRSAQ